MARLRTISHVVRVRENRLRHFAHFSSFNGIFDSGRHWRTLGFAVVSEEMQNIVRQQVAYVHLDFGAFALRHCAYRHQILGTTVEILNLAPFHIKSCKDSFLVTLHTVKYQVKLVL